MLLKVKLKNNLEIEGTTEEWLVAMLRVLTVEQQATVFKAVQSKLVAYETPGNYVLQCEPFHVGSAVRPLGGNGKR